MTAPRDAWLSKSPNRCTRPESPQPSSPEDVDQGTDDGDPARPSAPVRWASQDDAMGRGVRGQHPALWVSGAHKRSSVALAVSCRDGKGKKSKARMLAARAHTLYQHARQGPHKGSPMVSEPTPPPPAQSSRQSLSFHSRRAASQAYLIDPCNTITPSASRHALIVATSPPQASGCGSRGTSSV